MESGKKFVNQVIAGEVVVSTFYCEKKARLMGKTGPYLSVTLADKTGKLESRIWDNIDQHDALFNEGDFVRVKGEAVEYRGQTQLRVHKIRSVPDEDVDPTQYLPSSSKDIEQMEEDLRNKIAAMRTPALKQLVEVFINDLDFMTRFKRAPAAKAIHHPYLGGLLEHVLSIMDVVDLLCSHYTQLDRDLIIAGAFFHDVGKLKELSFDRSIDYTTEGRLMGHITIGIEIMNQGISKLKDFPSKYKTMLTHMLLSHHGQLEFGSPVLPQTLEAVVLSFMDDMDARINSFESILKQETKNPGEWTNWQRLYNRYLFNWEKSEEASAPQVVEENKQNKNGDSNSMELPFGIKSKDETD